jgi:hypothetical protein
MKKKGDFISQYMIDLYNNNLSKYTFNNKIFNDEELISTKLEILKFLFYTLGKNNL